MTPQSLPHVRVVQMLGGLGKLEAEAAGGDLALRMATIFGACACSGRRALFRANWFAMH